jgi:hypothetical protein
VLDTLTRSVVRRRPEGGAAERQEVFATRSRRNTSKVSLVSPGTRLRASEAKATYRPSALIDRTGP